MQAVTRAVSGLLGIDVVDVLLGGWKRHHDLRAAARRTLTDPEDHEIVKLAAHVVELSEHPSGRVLVDDLPGGDHPRRGGVPAVTPREGVRTTRRSSHHVDAARTIPAWSS